MPRRALVRDQTYAIQRKTLAGGIMARITRRRLLKLSASGAVAARTGGLAAVLATGRAPAFAQGTTVHWLRWADFVPASDLLLKGQITQECKKATGITLKVETVNANDLQARITSAIQSGTGPDIIMAIGNWPQLYTESLADVSDVTDEIGSAQGGYYDVNKLVATVGSKWIGVPWVVIGGLIAYRKSWFEEVGYKTFPETWDALLDAGKKLKAKGRPLGQTAGHTFGDAPAWWYPYLWSWGGKEVEADGKTVVLNSQETVESVKFATRLWKECCDEDGLAWDDTSNNRAFLSGSISATNNGASIYIEAKRKPDSYQTEKGAPMWLDILHARIPTGPGGQFNLPLPFTVHQGRRGQAWTLRRARAQAGDTGPCDPGGPARTGGGPNSDSRCSADGSSSGVGRPGCAAEGRRLYSGRAVRRRAPQTRRSDRNPSAGE